MIGTQANARAIAGDWEAAYRWNLIGYVISRQMRRSPWQIAQLIGANIERDTLQQFRAFLGRQAPSELGECWQAYVTQHERAFDNTVYDRTERLYGWDYTESIYQWSTGDPNYTHVESLIEMYVQRSIALPGGAGEPRPLYKNLDELRKAIRVSSLDKAWNVERELNAVAEAWDARPFHEAWPVVEEFRGRYCAIARREPVAALLGCCSLFGVGQARLPLTTRDAAFHGTALVVACHLYRAKHGRFPSDLAALAPEFIKEVPDDPCSGRPFVYRPSADGATFKLYGLGPNQKDDGGRETPPNLSEGDLVLWPVLPPEWQTPSWSQPAAP